MQCFEASIIFLVASCFRCHCHFCLGQTLGTHFRRIPLSTIESMPGARYGVSKEKDEQFPFSRINQAEPDVALFFAPVPSHPGRVFVRLRDCPLFQADSAARDRWICSVSKRASFFVLRVVFDFTVTFG